MIRKYSPNTMWGKQHVELVLMQWAYSFKIVIDVGGNCTGMSVLETAIGTLYNRLLPKDGGPAKVLLKDRKGNRLWCTDDEGRDDDWLKDMVVSARIVAWTPPTLNEVRKMNGAKPVPEGDQPWQPL